MIIKHFENIHYWEIYDWIWLFRYFTDILNMLQGVYVFLIFVCKQNVYEVLFVKRSEIPEGKSGKGKDLGHQIKEMEYVYKIWLSIRDHFIYCLNFIPNNIIFDALLINKNFAGQSSKMECFILNLIFFKYQN